LSAKSPEAYASFYSVHSELVELHFAISTSAYPFRLVASIHLYPLVPKIRHIL
jgi:hypothetical protein